MSNQPLAEQHLSQDELKARLQEQLTLQGEGFHILHDPLTNDQDFRETNRMLDHMDAAIGRTLIALGILAALVLVIAR